MSIVKSLAVRGITLIGVLFSVLFIVAITLGATGFSERMLTAIAVSYTHLTLPTSDLV